MTVGELPNRASPAMDSTRAATAAHVAPMADAEKAAAASFAGLVARLDYLSPGDIELVRRAYRFADEAHLGQMRSSGEPYITHPIAVAVQCTDWKLDAQALAAALLHDAMEDCGVTKTDLIDRFGAPIADLVDGLTKLDKLQFDTREENQAESFRKMLLAMARDVRVILIKLADRTHNMRTMDSMPRSKWGRISKETIEVFAPIAHRLGLNQTYRELQELAFKHLWPWRHRVLSKAVVRSRNRRRDLIQRVKNDVEAAFARSGIPVRVSGREKTLYSIYRKMTDKNLTFAQVTDIYGVRVVVAEVIDCYTAMGVLHQMYKPVPGKFKDYIAIPKVNGYQSLHTTVAGPSGINIEFQIRTEPMHLVAESGVAAHWLYKSQPGHFGPSTDRLGSQWLQSLLDIQNETRDAAEFWDHVKVDLFPDAVYVFTPKGQIMSLPRGATVVDFAYAIHSNVGDRTSSAKINGEPVPLRSELRNGDIVEIITTAVSTPNPAWLSFVKTGRARSKIRHHLKSLAQVESEQLGEILLTQALRAEGIEGLPAQVPQTHDLWERLLRFTGNRDRAELLTDIGLGKRVAIMVARKMLSLMAESGIRPNTVLLSTERFTAHEKVSQGAVILDGTENASVKYEVCCRPVPGDTIVGYMGRGEGLSVHRSECPLAMRQKHRDSERFLAVEWSDEPKRTFETGILITLSNGKGVLARVAAAIASAEADITHVDMGDESAQATTDLRFTVAVHDLAQLDAVLRSVRRTPSVVRANRILPLASQGSGAG